MNNIDKILQYLIPMASENIEIDGEIIENKVNSIVLSDKFFDIDGCNMCGHCCPPEHNVYVQFEYDAIMEYDLESIKEYGLPTHYLEDLKSNLDKSTHNINGKEVSLYTFNKKYPMMYLPRKGKEVQRCYWVHKRDDGCIVCGIHPVRSITCRMPHMRIFLNKRTGNVSITNTQFGRNWALGCQVEFHSPRTPEEFESSKQGKLEKLRYLQKIADEFNIGTYLPEICEYIENLTFDTYRYYLRKNIISQPKKLF